MNTSTFFNILPIYVLSILIYQLSFKVNTEQPLVNGPTDEDLTEETSKETSKQTAVENSEEMPLHAPPKPQSEPPVPPKEPPPEDDDIPTKAAPAVENKNEDQDSDHYYDRVPDQLDVSDDKDNDEDNFYEIPSSSKIPDVLPDDCLYVVSYGDNVYSVYIIYPHSKSESFIVFSCTSIY